MKKRIILPVFLFVCLGALWYFGHHRPAQKMLKAAPKKIYKATTPIAPEKSTVTPQTTEATTDEHTPTDAPRAASTDDTSEVSMNDTFKESTDDASEDSTKDNPDVQTAPAATEEALHPDTQWLIEESRRLVETRDARHAKIDAKTAAVMQILNQRMPEMISHLESLPLEEQTAYILRAKNALPNILILKALPPESYEGGWQMMRDMLVKHGYTLPPGVE